MVRIRLKPDQKRLRRIYAGPLSRSTSYDVKGDLLEKAGRIILDHVMREARDEYNRYPGSPGEPMNIPGHGRFWESFDFLVYDSSILITSTWPWIERHLEGREPFPMTWLTRENGVDRVPIDQGNGRVSIVMTPLFESDAWIHPGVRQLRFLERGVKKGRKAASDMIKKAAVEGVVGHIFRR